MSDDGKKDDPPNKSVPPNPMVGAATASIAAMFTDVVAAMSKDAVELIRKQPGATTNTTEAVAVFTQNMLEMLSARVGSALPTTWPPQAKPAKDPKGGGETQGS